MSAGLKADAPQRLTMAKRGTHEAPNRLRRPSFMEAAYAFRVTMAHRRSPTAHPLAGFMHSSPLSHDRLSALVNGRQRAMIQSNGDLAKHLRNEREIYARALEMYRTGQMRVGTNHMDTTTYLMNEL